MALSVHPEYCNIVMLVYRMCMRTRTIGEQGLLSYVVVSSCCCERIVETEVTIKVAR